MEPKRFTLFIDESGNDLLYDPEKFEQDPSLETHCTLLGVVIPHDKKDSLTEGLNKLKKEIFRTKEIVLHSSDIRQKIGAFVCFFYNPELYEKFKDGMNDLALDINPTIVCSSLDKKRWVEKFPRKLYFKDDPYEQAFEYLIERYAHYLNNISGKDVIGKLIMEDRGNAKKNARLVKTLSSLKRYGNQYFKANHFSRIADKIEFHAKKLNIPGLQLSDYYSYPFYINHKFPALPNAHYDFLERFIYPGDYARYGFKKWPV